MADGFRVGPPLTRRSLHGFFFLLQCLGLKSLVAFCSRLTDYNSYPPNDGEFPRVGRKCRMKIQAGLWMARTLCGHGELRRVYRF